MTPIHPDERPKDPAKGPETHRFRPHGHTVMWADGALVHVVAEGPFNREGADAFSLKMVELYRQLPVGQRVVNLTEFRTSMMATPDAWEGLAAHLGRVNDSGLALVATAWIAAPDVEGRALFLPRAALLFREFGRVLEGFESAAQAEAWARRQLAT